VAAPGVRVPVILNASAGLETANADELARRLGAERVDVRMVPPDRLAAEVRAAADEGAGIIGVAGGDGSIRTAAGILAGSDIALACIPTGTLNHFSRRVGIQDIGDAAIALHEGRTASLPVGIVQDDVFLNTLTFGEYPRIVRIRERFRGAMGKWPAAAVAFVAALFSMRRMRVSLHTANETLVRTTPLVWVGVGWGSFPRVHEALERRSDPDLEVAVLRSDSAFRSFTFLLRLGVRMILGAQPVRDQALDILHTPSLTLDLPHRIDATADGEVLRLSPPVEVGLRPRMLRVLLGPHADDGPG
jgi:diacylglycerol kinase family enzyme